jgi:GT2 family glycosyltransferase
VNICQKIYFRNCKNETSIIVLSHNAVDITKEFIKTLYNHTDPNKFNLIMIDNASSDGAVEFLSDYLKDLNNSILISNSENLGVIGGRNQGYNISSELDDKSKYILFIDNDQFVKEGWLEHHISVLERGYDIVGVEAWQMSKTFLPILHIQKLNCYFNYVGCGGMIVKKEVFEKIGILDERFNPCYFEDPDFVFRSYDAGFKIGWNMKAKIVHMPHQTLGKLNPQEKTNKFIKSLNEFRNKWKNRNLPVFYQKDLPEFH